GNALIEALLRWHTRVAGQLAVYRRFLSARRLLSPLLGPAPAGSLFPPALGHDLPHDFVPPLRQRAVCSVCRRLWNGNLPVSAVSRRSLVLRPLGVQLVQQLDPRA